MSPKRLIDKSKPMITPRPIQNLTTEDYDFLLGAEAMPYSTFFSKEVPIAPPATEVVSESVEQMKLWSRFAQMFRRSKVA